MAAVLSQRFFIGAERFIPTARRINQADTQRLATNRRRAAANCGSGAPDARPVWNAIRGRADSTPAFLLRPERSADYPRLVEEFRGHHPHPRLHELEEFRVPRAHAPADDDE